MKRGKVAEMLARQKKAAADAKSTPEALPISVKKSGGKRSGGKISALAGKLNFGIPSGMSPFGRGPPSGGVSPFGQRAPSMISPQSLPMYNSPMERRGGHNRTKSKSFTGGKGSATTSEMSHATMNRPALPRRRTPTPSKKSGSKVLSSASKK